MERNKFIDNLEITGKYFLKDGKHEIEVYTECVLGIDGKRKKYKSYDELFDVKIDNVTVGELVDKLKHYDQSFKYHIPVMFFNEKGEEVE